MAGNQGKNSAENGKLGGRPKLMASKLREAIIREAEERAAPLAKVLMDKAMEGDVPAIKEMMDRALGKALAQVEMSGPDGGPVRYEFSPEIAAAAMRMDELVKRQMYGETSETSETKQEELSTVADVMPEPVDEKMTEKITTE